MENQSRRRVYTVYTAVTVIVPSLVLVIVFGLLTHSTEGAVTAVAGGAVTVSNYTKIESPCLCKEFRCHVGGGFCLHASKVCNRVKDCPNNEDEGDLICKQAKANKKRDSGPGTAGTGLLGLQNKPKPSSPLPDCQQGEFKCKFGGCINITLVCDGAIHCPGATEEASDFCDYIHSS